MRQRRRENSSSRHLPGLGWPRWVWRLRFLLLVVLALLLWQLVPALGEGLGALWDMLVRTFGVGVYPLPLALALMLWTAWRQPGWFLRYWHRWLGGLGLSLALLTVLSFITTQQGMFAEAGLGGSLGQAIRDMLVSTFGLGVYTLPLALALVIWTVWQRPWWFLRYWHRWLGGLALSLALLAALSLTTTQQGMFASAGLGGNLGQAIRSLPAVVRGGAESFASIRLEPVDWRTGAWVVALALAGALLVGPRASLRLLRRLASLGDRGLRYLLWQLLRGLQRLAALGRQGLRYALRRLVQAMKLPALGVARRLRRWRQRPPTPAVEPPPLAEVAAPAPPVPETPIAEAGPAEAPSPEAPAAEAGPEEAPAPVSAWQLPPRDLLEATRMVVSDGAEAQRRARLLEEALASYGIEARVVEVSTGPTVTRFGIEPGWVRRFKEVPERDALGRNQRDEAGRPLTRTKEVSRTRVKVDAIASLSKDLALALAAPSLRIEAPVPGKRYVGIEVPNSTFTPVTLGSVMESEAFSRILARSKLALALGKGVGGEPVACDLATLPHLLIAGATGSGKSVCLKSLLTCLAMNATPEEVRLILVDPKRVELATFGRLPHLLFPPVVETDKAGLILRDIIQEMEQRYRKFSALKVTNLAAYNRTAPERRLPHLLIFVDELADLMMAAPYEVEQGLTRLAQLGRATGIHLVVATQRPSVDVVTGLIKANFPARISFTVSSQVDSRVILDAVGAEKLLGRGDMLYQPPDAPQPLRLQGVFVAEGEIERVVDFWSRQEAPAPRRIEPWPVPPSPPPPSPPRRPPKPVEVGDSMLQAARELAAQHSRVSPSLFQRRLRIGYTKAQELLETLEAEGVVGTADAGDSRPVLPLASQENTVHEAGAETAPHEPGG